MNAAAFPVSRPSLALLGTEPWRAACEWLSFQFSKQREAVGDGHTVVIFPGLATDGHVMQPLHRHCAALGYNAIDWGRGVNSGPKGDVDEWLAALATDVGAAIGTSSAPATLIGWSLGGIYARELAKLLPGRVRQVITIGTPFNTTGDHTNVGWLYRLVSGQQTEVPEALAARLRRPPPVPTTSIYSRNDGIVAWQSCCHDRRYRNTRDVAVEGSHLGMGWNPRVLEVIAERLAAPAGRHATATLASAN